MIPTRMNPLGNEPYKRRLQYLDTGNHWEDGAWIDTGYVPSRDGFKIELCAYTYSASTGDRYYFGVRTHNTSRGVDLGFNNLRVFTFAGGSGCNIVLSDLSEPFVMTMTYTKTGNNAYTLSMSSGGHSTSVSNLTTDDFIAPGVTLPLFRMYRYSEDTHEIVRTIASAQVRISRFSVYSSTGTLVRNMIPVLDWSDVPCMYDTAARAFFYNAGTSGFDYA